MGLAAGKEHREKQPAIFGGLTCWREAATCKVYSVLEAEAWGLAALINILGAGQISKFKKHFEVLKSDGEGEGAGKVVQAYNPSTWEFGSSLGNVARLCLNNNEMAGKVTVAKCWPDGLSLSPRIHRLEQEEQLTPESYPLTTAQLIHMHHDLCTHMCMHTQSNVVMMIT